MSHMRATMERQPHDLRALLADPSRCVPRRDAWPATASSSSARARASTPPATAPWLLRAAGVEAWAVAAFDAALHGPRPGAGDALVLLSHTGVKRFTGAVLADALAGMVPTVAIGGRGASGVDLPTVAPEQSSAYTASHLGALMRLAQLAVELGAPLGDLAAVPLGGAAPAAARGSPARARTPGPRPRVR
jgi:glucosamine--fructose-6-phosphate aminotransferase (isomerizing)